MGSKITKERSGKEVRSRKKPANLMPRLKEAAKLLVRNCERGFDDDTLCAKSHEVTARLLSQCCIIGLRQAKGWNNADIAEALIERDRMHPVI
jgi:hypothetical protein